MSSYITFFSDLSWALSPASYPTSFLSDHVLLPECSMFCVWFSTQMNTLFIWVIAADSSRYQRRCVVGYSLRTVPSGSTSLPPCCLWERRGSHSLRSSWGILIVTFWLAEVLGWLTARNPICSGVTMFGLGCLSWTVLYWAVSLNFAGVFHGGIDHSSPPWIQTYAKQQEQANKQTKNTTTTHRERYKIILYYTGIKI